MNKRFPTRVKAMLAAVLIALAMQTFPAPARALDIDVILPKTGGAAFLGKEEQKALELAEVEINKTGGVHGQPVHFVILDDQSSPQTSVQLGNRMVARAPSILLGSSLVSSCNAMSPLMKNGPVMYCFSPGIHPQQGSYVFSASVSTVDVARAQIQYFRMRGWTRIALMTSADATGQDAEQSINSALADPSNKDIVIVDRAHFNVTDVSVAAQIDHIRASNPQALIAWSTGTPIATVFKGIIGAGLDVPVATGFGNMTYAQMEQYAAFLPKDLFIASPGWVRHAGVLTLDPKVEEAQKRFFDTFDGAHMKPDIGATLSWDPAMIVIDALRHLELNASPAQVREYLTQLKGFAGVNGIYDFPANPQRGLGGDSVVVTRWNATQQSFEMVSKPGGVPISR
ncbi:ABC transporter substrate-binding protein [Roseiarcaceae bacterium H3SJ34-1]|uniref:ABC transporter substrate-binding protein n=1 Tax=Terripilifer ovatus TaxID=3032367 RepID=UPI003AB9A2AA|nr:ABC transporter substrate-binding protein [Roseiarcaceae bacterium H3SJ34-1]